MVPLPCHTASTHPLYKILSKLRMLTWNVSVLLTCVPFENEKQPNTCISAPLRCCIRVLLHFFREWRQRSLAATITTTNHHRWQNEHCKKSALLCVSVFRRWNQSYLHSSASTHSWQDFFWHRIDPIHTDLTKSRIDDRWHNWITYSGSEWERISSGVDEQRPSVALHELHWMCIMYIQLNRGPVCNKTWRTNIYWSCTRLQLSQSSYDGGPLTLTTILIPFDQVRLRVSVSHYNSTHSPLSLGDRCISTFAQLVLARCYRVSWTTDSETCFKTPRVWWWANERKYVD